MEPSQIITPPEPMMTGTFALYELPDGGRVIAYRAVGEESHQIMIPAMVIKLMERAGIGERISPMEMLKAAMGGT